jgi:hypothetical protein
VLALRVIAFEIQHRVVRTAEDRLRINADRSEPERTSRPRLRANGVTSQWK